MQNRFQYDQIYIIFSGIVINCKAFHFCYRTFNSNYTESIKNKEIKGSLTLTISENPNTMDTVSETKNVVVGQSLYLFLRGPGKKKDIGSLCSGLI